jgi:hypothetical protein
VVLMHPTERTEELKHLIPFLRLLWHGRSFP